MWILFRTGWSVWHRVIRFNMLVFRIAHKKYAQGLSVSGLAGRWNSDGKLVLYTAENVSLALLENMIYRMGTGFNHDYKIMVIDIPENCCHTIDPTMLPKDWRQQECYPQLQRIGNHWYDERKYLCLKVPSSVMPENFNVILNTTQGDFSRVKLVEVLPYEPDERLEKLLKKYPS